MNVRHIFGILSIFILVILFVIPRVSIADLADELAAKIDIQNSEIEKLEAEIASYQLELQKTSKNAQTLKNSIAELDLGRKKLLAEIKVTESKIKTAELSISQLTLAIGDKTKVIDYNKVAIANSIVRINELEIQPLVWSLLTNENMADLWREIDTLKEVQADIQEHTKEVQTVKLDLEDTRSVEEKAKDRLLILKAELRDQEKILNQNISDKNYLLAETKNQESNYQKILADKLALKTAFESELQNYESQLQYILDPNSIPKAGSAPLAWPLDHVFITQMFGKTADSGRLYASGSHSGVDFGTSTGTPIYAMADGTLVAQGDTDTACPGASFGKWVLIKYDDGLASTYGHLSLINKVKSGSKVKEGQIVAYSGNTGHSTGPHLHVSLYPADAVEVSPKESLACKGKILEQPRAATSAYLDPLLYMPFYTSAMVKSGI